MIILALGITEGTLTAQQRAGFISPPRRQRDMKWSLNVTHFAGHLCKEILHTCCLLEHKRKNWSRKESSSVIKTCVQGIFCFFGEKSIILIPTPEKKVPKIIIWHKVFIFLILRLLGIKSQHLSLSSPTGDHGKSSLLQSLITITVSMGFTMEQ